MKSRREHLSRFGTLNKDDSLGLPYKQTPVDDNEDDNVIDDEEEGTGKGK